MTDYESCPASKDCLVATHSNMSHGNCDAGDQAMTDTGKKTCGDCPWAKTYYGVTKPEALICQLDRCGVFVYTNECKHRRAFRVVRDYIRNHDTLEAENQRLREALEEISLEIWDGEDADFEDWFYGGVDYVTVHKTVRSIRKIVLKALGVRDD